MAEAVRIRSAPAFFALGRSRDAIATGEAYGCTCAHCGTHLAAPMSMQRQAIWCLYCGLDRGILPNIEIAPDTELEFPFLGLTAAEALSMMAAGEFEVSFRKDVDLSRAELAQLTVERADASDPQSASGSISARSCSSEAP